MILRKQFEKETGFEIDYDNGTPETLHNGMLVSTNSASYFIELAKWLENRDKIRELEYKKAIELLDGALPIIEIYKPEGNYSIEWKYNWVTDARMLVNHFHTKNDGIQSDGSIVKDGVVVDHIRG
jgi:hypothetical protein